MSSPRRSIFESPTSPEEGAGELPPFGASFGEITDFIFRGNTSIPRPDSPTLPSTFGRTRAASLFVGDAYFHKYPASWRFPPNRRFPNHPPLAELSLRSTAIRYNEALQNPLTLVPSGLQAFRLGRAICNACVLFTHALNIATTPAEADAALSTLSIQMTDIVNDLLSNLNRRPTDDEVDVALENLTIAEREQAIDNDQHAAEADAHLQAEIRAVRNGVLPRRAAVTEFIAATEAYVRYEIEQITTQLESYLHLVNDQNLAAEEEEHVEEEQEDN